MRVGGTPPCFALWGPPLLEPVFHFQGGHLVEMPAVAGNKGEIVVECHPGQPDVLQCRILSRAGKCGHDVSGSESIRLLKGQDLESIQDVPLDSCPKGGGFGGAGRSKTKLKGSHRANEEAAAWLVVQAAHDLRVGRALDQ